MDNVKPVIIAKKVLHKGQMFGHVSNGGGVIPISHNISLRFVALNDKFVEVQVMNHGIGSEIKPQTWVKGQKTKQDKQQKIGNQVKIVELVSNLETESIL